MNSKKKDVQGLGNACPWCARWRETQQTNECHPLCTSAYCFPTKQPEWWAIYEDESYNAWLTSTVREGQAWRITEDPDSAYCFPTKQAAEEAIVAYGGLLDGYWCVVEAGGSAAKRALDRDPYIVRDGRPAACPRCGKGEWQFKGNCWPLHLCDHCKAVDNWADGMRQAASVVRAEVAKYPDPVSAVLLAPLAAKLEGLAYHYPGERERRRASARHDAAIARMVTLVEGYQALYAKACEILEQQDDVPADVLRSITRGEGRLQDRVNAQWPGDSGALPEPVSSGGPRDE